MLQSRFFLALCFWRTDPFLVIALILKDLLSGSRVNQIRGILFSPHNSIMKAAGEIDLAHVHALPEVSQLMSMKAGIALHSLDF